MAIGNMMQSLRHRAGSVLSGALASMDFWVKFLVVLAFGALLLAANVALLRTLANWWQGGAFTIGSFVVVQPPTGFDKLNESLGQFLFAEYKHIESEVKNLELFARTTDPKTISAPPFSSAPSFSFKIGGVEASGALSWFQSFFVSEKVLNFVISFEQNKALVASDISSLSRRQPYLHFEISDATPRKIASRLAHALYQAQMAQSDSKEATSLDPADFQSLVETLSAVQALDQRTKGEIIIAPEEYVPHLAKIAEITKKTPKWRRLVETQAGLAIAARRQDQAREIYSRLVEQPDLSAEDRRRYQMQLASLKQLSLPTVVAADAVVLTRKNINSLTSDELQALKATLKTLYSDQSPNGYQAIAGLFSRYVPLKSPLDSDAQLLYLAWHRAYLAYFETSLRRLNAAVSLPFWDWSQELRVPPAVQGGADNVLAAGPLRLASADGRVLQERSTTRALSPSPPASAAAQLRDVLATTDLRRFESLVWQAHNYVHVAVGGDMATVESAAFDPLFWMLEANADRLWAEWQARNPTAQIADSVLNQKLEPFGKTVRDVLATESLGYKY